MMIAVSYDPINGVVSIIQNDFRAIEAFGILEYAKAMILANEFSGDDLCEG